jgi:hypothetical protein
MDSEAIAARILTWPPSCREIESSLFQLTLRIPGGESHFGVVTCSGGQSGSPIRSKELVPSRSFESGRTDG